MRTAKRWFWAVVTALTMSLVVGILWTPGEIRAGWTHTYGCGGGCIDGHNLTACICRPDYSDCMEIDCCNYSTHVYLAADNLDTADWSCPGDGTVGLHAMCPCGHYSSFYSDAWDPYECGTCGTRQWQNCVRDGRIAISGAVPCHNWVDPGWCRSETGSSQPCTPEGQSRGTLSNCDTEQ